MLQQSKCSLLINLACLIFALVATLFVLAAFGIAQGVVILFALSLYRSGQYDMHSGCPLLEGSICTVFNRLFLYWNNFLYSAFPLGVICTIGECCLLVALLYQINKRTTVSLAPGLYTQEQHDAGETEEFERIQQIMASETEDSDPFLDPAFGPK